MPHVRVWDGDWIDRRTARRGTQALGRIRRCNGTAARLGRESVIQGAVERVAVLHVHAHALPARLDLERAGPDRRASPAEIAMTTDAHCTLASISDP